LQSSVGLAVDLAVGEPNRTLTVLIPISGFAFRA
jgi:hypothetical protein